MPFRECLKDRKFEHVASKIISNEQIKLLNDHSFKLDNLASTQAAEMKELE